MHVTILSIVSFMKTDAGKAVILLGGGIGNHVYMSTVKLHDVLKKRTLLYSPCAVSLNLVPSVAMDQSRIPHSVCFNSLDR